MKMKKLRKVRHKRVRKRVKGTEQRPRLCVYRSNKHTYAQIINDELGKTIASVSTLSGEFSALLKNAPLVAGDEGKLTEPSSGMPLKPATQDAAFLVGKLIAQKAKQAGVKEVCFDRAGYLYHGKIKKLSQGAREGGLIF
ncbi:50S ribosomal protein L18 [Candidatus Omnitrophota bacterium]